MKHPTPQPGDEWVSRADGRVVVVNHVDIVYGTMSYRTKGHRTEASSARSGAHRRGRIYPMCSSRIALFVRKYKPAADGGSCDLAGVALS